MSFGLLRNDDVLLDRIAHARTSGARDAIRVVVTYRTRCRTNSTFKQGECAYRGRGRCKWLGSTTLPFREIPSKVALQIVYTGVNFPTIFYAQNFKWIG